MSLDLHQTPAAVRFCCPFVPAEWIAAHGLKPVRVAPPAARRHCPDGACPYAHAYAELAADLPNDPFIFTTACDQMRRHAELAGQCNGSNIFLMHVPTTWKPTSAIGLYRSELERLGRFLCRRGGANPTADALRSAILHWESRRTELLRLRKESEAGQWPELLRQFHDDAPFTANPAKSEKCNGIVLALVGSPLLASQLQIHAILSRLGGRVVVDATDAGERSFPHYDNRLLAEDPMKAMAEAYFCQIPDAFRRPNDSLFEWMVDACALHRVRGIVFHRQLWCDTWHAEAQRMREQIPIPMLVLETGGEAEPGAHACTRLQAFMETLK